MPKQGYYPYKIRTLTEHGCDIVAKRRLGNVYYVIEVKGEPEPKLFYGYLTNALGELVQHMTNKLHCRYAVGLPASFEEIVRRRIPPVAMQKIGLEFLLVNEKKKVSRLTWKDLG